MAILCAAVILGTRNPWFVESIANIDDGYKSASPVDFDKIQP